MEDFQIDDDKLTKLLETFPKEKNLLTDFDRFIEDHLITIKDRIILVSDIDEIEILKDSITTIRIPPCNSNNLGIKTEEGYIYLIIRTKQ